MSPLSLFTSSNPNTIFCRTEKNPYSCCQCQIKIFPLNIDTLKSRKKANKNRLKCIDKNIIDSTWSPFPHDEVKLLFLFDLVIRFFFICVPTDLICFDLSTGTVTSSYYNNRIYNSLLKYSSRLLIRGTPYRGIFAVLSVFLPELSIFCHISHGRLFC